MHHRPVGRPLLLEDAQHVVVGVTVVDLQGLAGPLGEVDVPAERILLHPNALRPGAVVVEPRLADRPAPAGAPPAPRSPRRPPSRSPVAASLGASLGCRATPPSIAGCWSTISTVNRAPGRSHPIWTSAVDPDRLAPRRGPPRRRGRPRRRARCRGGCGCRRPGWAAGRARRAPARDRCGRPCPCPAQASSGPLVSSARRLGRQLCSSRASSSSTTDSSSLVKIGVGLTTVAPTTTGTDSQRGVRE